MLSWRSIQTRQAYWTGIMASQELAEKSFLIETTAPGKDFAPNLVEAIMTVHYECFSLCLSGLHIKVEI